MYNEIMLSVLNISYVVNMHNIIYVILVSFAIDIMYFVYTAQIIYNFGLYPA